MKILDTDAVGFVGRSVARNMVRRGHKVVKVVSKENPNSVHIGDINAHTDWTKVLSGRETVVHLAARAHVMHDTTSDPLVEYRGVKVEAHLTSHEKLRRPVC